MKGHPVGVDQPERVNMIIRVVDFRMGLTGRRLPLLAKQMALKVVQGV